MKFLVLLPALLAGCVSTSSVPPVQYYVLGIDTHRAAARPASQKSRMLLVQPTAVNAFYDTQRLVFSRRDGQRAYYQFAAWTERPGRAFSELLARRLDAPSTTSGVKGDVILFTRIEELYHDASVTPGSVKIAVSAELVDAAGRMVGGARRFTRRVPAGSENAAGAVDAANRAVAEVLEEIAAWALGAQTGRNPRVEPAGQRPHVADAAAPQ